jgi:2-C-methyl-D-erythritol 4-phosphate cytidylyltransferase
MQDIFFLVPCAGFGARMNMDIPKQYILHHGKPLVYYTIKELAKFKLKIVLVVSSCDNNIDAYQHLFPSNLTIAKVGGETRAETVKNGIEYAINILKIPLTAWILVHDVARPLVKFNDIQNLIQACIKDGNACGGILAIPAVDTLKIINDTTTIDTNLNQNYTHNYHNSIYINFTLNRNIIYQAQTPQMFRLEILRLALEKSLHYTDESSAVENLGLSPLIVYGSKLNIKITHIEDLAWLHFLD